MEVFAVNQELRFSCPEGFHVMDAKERSKLNFYGDGEFECLTDPERHIIISIGWRQLRGLAERLAGVENAVKTMEKRLRKPMQQFGYRMLNTKDTLLDGETAKGYCYEYEVQEIAMVGESFVCRRNRTMYYLHVYYRKAMQEASAPVWEEIMASMRWINRFSVTQQ